VKETPALVSDSTLSSNLLCSLKTGSGEAWRRLVRLYGPLVYAWCRRRGLQEVDAEEVSQQVFLQVMRSLPAFRRTEPGDSFRGWFWTIARRRLADFRRRQNHEPQAVGGTDAQHNLAQQPGEPLALETDATESMGSVLRRALELIRTRFQENTWRAFWLTTVEGRPMSDVAAELRMTPNAVFIARSRVLAYLKAEFGDLVE
jgi:RNA polymerase sigma-70 factor, ECF subfamily